MKRLIIVYALLFLLSGCSDKSNDWYDDVAGEDSEKESFINTMGGAGMSPEEAERQYEQRKIMLQTEGLKEPPAKGQ